jgi:GNAT superfamily N-acetyltransferase
MTSTIVTVSDRPHLAPLVARWRVEAFFNHPGGYTVEEMTALILEPRVGPEETFVLFDHGRPVGTVALICSDMDTRPDLTPWLAGLFVDPAFRRRGHATRLVRKIEARARSSSVPVLWLYTSTAESLYSRLGWRRAGIEDDRGEKVVLMKRTLSDKHYVVTDRTAR